MASSTFAVTLITLADLKPSEVEQAAFVVSVYQTGEKGTLDAFFLGEFLRALNLNPSLDTLEKMGMTKKEGQKFFTLEELLPIYSQMKKEKKDQGCYEDFVECLKLYDKEENGKMMLAELSHSLLALAEKLTDAQVDELFDDCLPEEDDDGMIEYDIFLKKMCDRA